MEKKKIAQKRNYFKYVIAGMIKPVDKNVLTSSEQTRYDQIIRLQNRLLENFDKSSREMGLDVPIKCFCNKPAYYKTTVNNKTMYLCNKHFKNCDYPKTNIIKIR